MIWVDQNGRSVDEDGKLHSYDDQPIESSMSGFEKTAKHNLSWYQHGEVHRDGDKPARLVSGKYRYWFKKGLAHRTDGSAITYKNKEQKYILYNVSMGKKSFLSILKRAQEFSLPLWVSWLVQLEFIKFEDALAFRNEDGSWNDDLPAEWILKALNINKQTLLEKPLSSNKYTFVNDLNRASFSFMECFINVINYEKENGEFYSTSTI